MIPNSDLRSQSTPISRLDACLTHTGAPDELVARDRMRRSHAFVFDASMISADLVKGGIDYAEQLAEYGLLSLPFDNITVQIGPVEEDEDGTVCAKTYGASSHIIISAWKVGDQVFARFYWVGLTGAVSGGRRSYSIDMKSRLKEWRERGAGSICTPDPYAPPWITAADNVSDDEHAIIGAQMCGAWLFGAIGVLNSQGVDQTHVGAPKWLNANREKKGKSPLYGFNWVTIDVSALKIPGAALGGGHAPPRLHWRRGHVRRLSSGAVTTVRPCLVGDVSRGAIEKRYAVRA